MEHREFTCCICNKVFVGYGNNPWPVKENGECCNKCNREEVIPARLKQHYDKLTEENKSKRRSIWKIFKK